MSLPSGYKRLEYIQSTGTQHIDTNFIPNQDTRLDIIAVPLSVADAADGSGFIPYGAGESYASKAFECYTSGQKYEFNYDGQYEINLGATVGEKIVISHDKNNISCSIDGGDLYTHSFNYISFVAPRSLTLFGINRATVAHGLQKVYSCQIYDNGTLIRDFIPCNNASGETGLWDNVNNVFYGNAGTGTFTAGPEAEISTPANFRVFSMTGDEAVLAWDAVDGAIGYKLYKDDILISETADTAYTVQIKLFATAQYQLTAYNDSQESAPAVLTVSNFPDNPLLYLVTDRTESDVVAGNKKGTYNYTDLNRVGTAVRYLADLMNGYGYDIHVTAKRNWTENDAPKAGQMARYLADVAAVRGAWTMMEITPKVPGSMEKLTWQSANDIEKILEDIDTLLANIMAAWFYSGELYSGEV